MFTYNRSVLKTKHNIEISNNRDMISNSCKKTNCKPPIHNTLHFFQSTSSPLALTKNLVYLHSSDDFWSNIRRQFWLWYIIESF